MTTRFRRLGLGVVDQALSSLSNVLFLVAAARSAGVDEFGAVSFAYALFAFGMSVQRSSLGLLVSLSSGSRQPPPLVLSLLWATLVAGLGVVLGRTIGDGGTWAYYVLVGAALVIYPQDLLRYSAIAERRADRATLSDGAWFVVTLALLLSTLAGLSLDVTAMSLIWVLGGGGAALLVMLLTQRQDLHANNGEWLRRHVGELRILGPDALLASLAPLLLAAVMTSYMTFGDVAAVRGAGTLLGPAAVLFAALPAVMVPELVRVLGADRSRLAAAQAAVMSVLVLAWAMCLILVPASIGEQVLGETWAVSRAILPWVVMEQVVWALATGPISLLSAYRRWRMLLTVRVVYLVAVACALALTVPSGDIEWVMSGMVAAAAANCAVLWFAAHHVSRDLPVTEPVSGPPSQRRD
jgi:O-antigen/teichoic acid export membrane protein